MRPFVAPVSHRERLLGAAAQYTAEHGWSTLTMGKLAELVGVSRQTVYNEIGGKPQLAEAMILRELETFLGRVDAAFSDNPTDLVRAIETAAVNVLELARTDPLLHMVVRSSQGAESDLLPLLTTHAGSLLAVAKMVVTERVASYDVPLASRDVDAAIDMVVRVVLSHVMQPSDSPEATAADIAWIAERVLRA